MAQASLREDLPEDVRPAYPFRSLRARCESGTDFLFDKHWLTHPGRMAAYCPHNPSHPDYRVSLCELPDDLPEETRRHWVRGFLAGNLPRPSLTVQANPELFRQWEEAAEEFSITGEWWFEDPADSDT